MISAKITRVLKKGDRITIGPLEWTAGRECKLEITGNAIIDNDLIENFKVKSNLFKKRYGYVESEKESFNFYRNTYDKEILIVDKSKTTYANMFLTIYSSDESKKPEFHMLSTRGLSEVYPIVIDRSKGTITM